MQSVRLLVPRETEFRGGDGFDVFGDGGGGAIDFSAPLVPRRMRLWAESAGRRGHVLDGHLVLRHLDSVDPDGHLTGLHFHDRFLMPGGALAVEVGRYVFGRFLHAVRMYDAYGNTHGAAPVTLDTVINSVPARPRRLTAKSYDPVGDRVTFSFEPSPKLVG